MNVANGHCIKRYHPSDQVNNISSLIEVPHDWNELFVITDVEVDRATEQDFGILLRDYLASIKRRVMISPDQQTIEVFDAMSATFIGAYKPEEIIPAE